MKATIDITFTSACGHRRSGLQDLVIPLFYSTYGINGQVIISGCDRDDFDHVKIVLEGELYTYGLFRIKMTSCTQAIYPPLFSM